MNMKTCDRRGRIGDAPSKEEFCIAHRAQKLAEQYKCPLIRYHEEFMKTNEMDTEGENVLKKNIEHLGNVGGIGKGSCGKYKNGGKTGNDVPRIWRKHMGNIVKGTFCNLDGEWYWQKVASCGCKNCRGEDNYSLDDDWMNNGSMDDMMIDFDDNDMMGEDFMPIPTLNVPDF